MWMCLTFLIDNFDKTKRTAARKPATAKCLTSSKALPTQSEQAFNEAIRNAERTRNTAQANTLKQQRTEFLDAVKNGVIDANGQRINKQ
jgi:hypothetical protein